MLAWKIAPGARGRQHGGAEAGRIHAAHRAGLRRDLPRGRPAAGRRQHRHRRRRDRRRAGRAIPASTRSPSPARPRSGALIREATAGSGKKLSLELGGKSPFIVFDDADLDGAVEGVVDAIWFNQGQVCCAGSRLLVQEGVAERFYAKLQAAHGDAARRRSARQVDRHRRHRGAGAARSASASSWPRARPRARTLFQADGRAARRRAASSRRRCSPTSSPPRRSPRSRSSGRCGRHDVPHARRGGGARQQHALRPRGLDLVGEHQPRARRRRARIKAGVVWINSHQHVRRRRRLRRLQGKRLRPRRRPRGARTNISSPPGSRPRRARRRGAAEAFRPCRPRPRRRRAAARASTAPPSSISAASRRGRTAGYSYTVRDADGRAARPGRARQPQGHPQRRRGGRQGRAPGAPPRRTTAPRCSTTSPRTSPPAPASSTTACARMTGASARGGGARGRGRGPRAPSSTPPGPTNTTAQVHATAVAPRHARDERALGRHGPRLPRRGAAARPSSRC